MRWLSVLSVVGLLGSPLSTGPRAQGSGTKEPSLVVVSVKPTAPGTRTMTQMVSGNRLDYLNRPLDVIILAAMGGSKYLLEGMPDWATRESFDITLTADERLDPRDASGLLRQVLERRFALNWHRATRRIPVYALVRADPGKLGPGLVVLDKDCTVDLVTRSAPCRFEMRSDGKKIGETQWSVIFNLIRIGPAGQERPVIDLTGLTGSVRVDAEWTRRPDDGLPTVFTALREQMGLRLEPRDETMEIVVIDSIDRPTPN